jgi:hypothetical protein
VTADALPATTLGGRLAPGFGSGRFRVERPGTRADRALATLLRLPRAGSDVAVTLQVRGGDGDDRWERSFDGRRLTSRQHLVDGAVCERVGPVELRFQATGSPSGACGLRSVGAALVIGRRRWRLAARWTPVISCKVVPLAGDRRRVAVQVAAPCGRVLSRYSGVLVDLPQDQPELGS